MPVPNQSRDAVPSAGESDRSAALESNAIGAFGAAALGVVMMAPALGVYANLSLVFSSAGNATPLVFVLALALTLPTALSYAMVSQEIPSAGSTYTWISQSINRFAGSWAGLLLLVSYGAAVVLQPILFGLFFNELLAALLPIQPSYVTWAAGALLSTAVVALFAYPGIRISANGSVVLAVIEIVVVLALCCTFLARGSPPVTILPAVSDNPRGLMKGLVFALLSFVGFSVITTAAEETNSPRTVIPRVIVLACTFLGLFWAFSAWAFAWVVPLQVWSDSVAKGLNPVVAAARTHWGHGGTGVIMIALLSVVGVHVASVVGFARVAYTMSQAGDLPRWLGKLHPRTQTPWNAQHLVLSATTVLALIWGRWIGLYLSYDWWGTSLVIFALLSNALANVGCVAFFYRFRREQFRWFRHGAIPAIGFTASLGPLYYSCGPELWKSGWQGGQSIILFSCVTIVLSALYSVRARSKERKPAEARQ